MKKILVTMLVVAFLLPLSAAAQTWVEPSMRPDGIMDPGHWSTKGDDWQKLFSTPGNMNPFIGQFNTYGRRNPLTSTAPQTTGSGTTRSYSLPGSNSPNPFLIPGSNSPSRFLIPGSTAPNPYTALGSNPNPLKPPASPGNP